MVDQAVLAARIAAIRDAVERIHEVRPHTLAAFQADRSAREIVTLNLFRAIQDAIAIATHWAVDEGWGMPQSHGDVFTMLGDRGVVDAHLAQRLRAAAGLRNLIAHQYGALDYERLYQVASHDVEDLLEFCRQLAVWPPKP